MLFQPRGNGLRRAVREQSNGLTALQVTDQRPVTQSALACPVIQANDARLGLGRLWSAADQTQDGIATPAVALLLTNIGSRLAADSQSKLTEGLLQSLGTLGVRVAECWEAFSKDLLGAGALFAEETTDMKTKTDRTPSGGKLAQRACIATLDVRRCSPT